jgi:hypothetical protein
MIGSQNGDNVTGSFTLTANAPVDVALSYRNYGLSPALKSAELFQAVLGNVPPESDADWRSDTAPNVPNCHQQVDRITGVTLFPNPGSFYLTAHQSYDTRPSFSTPDIDAVKAGKKTLFVVGCVGYLDQWDVRHHTDLCSYFSHPDNSLTGTFAYCALGNQAD